MQWDQGHGRTLRDLQEGSGESVGETIKDSCSGPGPGRHGGPRHPGGSTQTGSPQVRSENISEASKPTQKPAHPLSHFLLVPCSVWFSPKASRKPLGTWWFVKVFSQVGSGLPSGPGVYVAAAALLTQNVGVRVAGAREA